MTLAGVTAWMQKAEGDLKVALDELATDAPVTDAVCFHCQQCAEKCLKAYLICRQHEVPRTHNLAELLVRCTELDPQFQELLDSDVPGLTSYAVATRYPSNDKPPTLEEAGRAIQLAERVRGFVQAKLAEAGCHLLRDDRP